MTTAKPIHKLLDPPPSPAAAATPARPRRATWARYGLAALWVGAVGAVAMLCAADLFPQWLAERSQPYLTLAAGSFVVETLQFHIGLACLACCAIAAVRRRWRLL